MSRYDAEADLLSRIAVTREDVTRAKAFVLASPHTAVDSMVDDWLQVQKVPKADVVNPDAHDVADQVATVARHISLRMSLYQAVWELVSACELLPASTPQPWSTHVTSKSSHMGGPLLSKPVTFVRLGTIQRSPQVSTFSTDPDVFLQGAVSPSLHYGIREAVEQSLQCFRRGLYLPATVMMAAAAEGTWIECGLAVAKHLSDQKLHDTTDDLYVGISRKVIRIRDALASGNAKPLLHRAEQTIARVNDAEVWTTVLRERRNALHWGKAKSFVADLSSTASIMLGAPMYLNTLEAIRAAC